MLELLFGTSGYNGLCGIACVVFGASWQHQSPDMRYVAGAYGPHSPLWSSCACQTNGHMRAPQQARLVKAAMRDALAQLKRARPLALFNAFEQRMSHLGTMAGALACIVGRSSPGCRMQACAALQCSLPELADAVQVCGHLQVCFRTRRKC